MPGALAQPVRRRHVVRRVDQYRRRGGLALLLSPLNIDTPRRPRRERTPLAAAPLCARRRGRQADRARPRGRRPRRREVAVHNHAVEPPQVDARRLADDGVFAEIGAALALVRAGGRRVGGARGSSSDIPGAVDLRRGDRRPALLRLQPLLPPAVVSGGEEEQERHESESRGTAQGDAHRYTRVSFVGVGLVLRDGRVTGELRMWGGNSAARGGNQFVHRDEVRSAADLSVVAGARQGAVVGGGLGRG